MTTTVVDEYGMALNRADRINRLRALVVSSAAMAGALAVGLLARRAPLMCLGMLLAAGMAAIVWWRPP